MPQNGATETARLSADERQQTLQRLMEQVQLQRPGTAPASAEQLGP